MQTYRLSAWDINTNVLLTDLEGSEASFNERLNDAGEFSFKLSLTNPLVKDLTAVILGLGDVPFKVLLTANDNSSILYAGFAWKPSLSKGSSDLTISGKAMPDYFRMVTMAASYTTSISPVTLMQNVVANVQAQPGCNVGILTRQQVSASPANIVPAYPKAQRGTVAQALSDTTAAITPGTGGIDFYMEHAFVNGAPQHTMVVAAPRAGRSSATSQFVVDLATALDFTRDADATASGNHLYVVGQGSGGVQPVVESWAQFPVGGLGQLPRLEQVLQYSHVADTKHLANLANGMVQMYGRPVAVMTVELPADYEVMPLGSFIVGDDVRVWCEAGVLPHFPTGVNEWWRIVAYRIDLGNDGTAKYSLTLNRPPVF
jgi:hypothetical protein